jgi:cyclic pyranopterin monophosphate synthase
VELTHFNSSGKARMVDVTGKLETERVAVAQGAILLLPATLQLIEEGKIGKGDVLAVAQVAGIMAAKKTSDIIPMCHILQLTGVDLVFEICREQHKIFCKATVKNYGKTGVEMEALTAVTVALLTIYDMCKAVDKTMVLEDVCLLEKYGGKSGLFQRGRVGEHV